MRLAPLLLAGAVGLTFGCSLARGVLGSAQLHDAGPEQDAWIEPGDAGADEDAGTDAGEDAAIPCAARCDGNTAVTCNLGRESRTVCDATVCDDTGAFPMCLPLVCSPDVGSCSMDGTSADVCNHLGTRLAHTHCDRGCTAGACRAELACTQVLGATITSSTTMTIDLCEKLNDNDYASTHGDCPTVTPANGEDVMFRLQLDRTLHVVVTASDADGSRSVDPVLYLRAECGVRSSEIDCNDDGGPSNASLLDEVLTAGEYFLVLDSFEWMSPSATCGNVQLDVTITPL